MYLNTLLTLFPWAICAIASFFQIERKKKLGLFIFLITYLITLVTFFEFGDDRPVYIQRFYDFPPVGEVIFNYKQHLELFNRSEIGFNILSSGIRQIFGSHIAFFFLVGTFSLIPTFFFIKKYSSNIFLSFALYISTFFLLNEMDHIRQGLATAIFLLSLYLYEKKYSSSILTISSPLFHMVGLLGISRFFIHKILKEWRLILFLLITGFLFSLVYGIQNLGLKLEEMGIISESYSKYLFKSPHSFPIGLFRLKTIKFLAISFLIYYFDKKIIEKGEVYFLISRLYVFGVIVYLFFNSNTILGGRLPELFIFFEVILLPLFISFMPKQMQNKGQYFVLAYSGLTIVKFFL